MRRRLFIIFGSLLAGTVLLLAFLPWWMEPVARSIGRRFGAEFKRYERLGYARFAVHEVVVTRRNVKVQVARAETNTPLLWLWHHGFGQPSTVTTGEWRVDVTPSTTVIAPSESSPEIGATRLRAILFKVADGLDRWLPQATIGAGVVTWKGGELRLDAAEWKDRTLTVKPLRYGVQAADVRATFSARGELLLAVESKTALPWRGSLKSVRDEISGELRLWDQPATVFARLPAQGWMFSECKIEAPHWAVSGAELKLGPAYATVRGAGQLEWREGRFTASADVAGDVEPGKKAPPLLTKVRAQGDGQAVTIDSFLIDLPGVKAKLDQPAIFSRNADTATTPSRFTLEIDLEKQPWIPTAKGRVTGSAEVTSVAAKPPVVVAKLEATDLSVREWPIARFIGAATFTWPTLSVKEVAIGFAEGGQLTGSGEWNFPASELRDGAVQGELRLAALRRWLPASVRFDSLALAVKARGPMGALQHEGGAQLSGFTAPHVNPLGLDVTWTGVGAAIKVSEGHVRAANSRLTLAGRVDAKSASVSVLKWEQGDAERLSLVQPATITWSPALTVGPLQFRGANADVELAAALGESGRLDAKVRGVSSAWLKDFVTIPGPEWQVTSLDAQSLWARGPVKFSLRSDLAVTLAPERSANVAVVVGSDGDRIQVDSIRVAEGESAIVNASGQLPLSFYPGTEKFWRMAGDAPLALRATTTSNPAFWKRLTEAVGLEFAEPEVDINLAGTWNRPEGEVTARATRLAVDPQRFKFPLPTVDALDLHATADGQGIKVDRFAVKVEGQEVRASGSLPLNTKQWDELRRAPFDYLHREATLRLEIPDAEVSAFSRYVGQYLAPTGRLQVDLTMDRGGEMAGALRLQNAATRPLGPLGVLQEVQAEARLAGRNIEVKNVTARAGGQPVTLSGRVELPVGASPKFDLALVGENFPLIRQTGLLMRADLDLKLVTQPDEVTAVTGTVNLRDSMFLSDVRALIPKGGGGGPARRPPFFAVEFPPLDAWRLAVDVRGDEFLRLRSTVFVGVASARFHLGGTLGEPRATGEAAVDSGQVLLPFATFRVEQGTVRLTEADPYSLQLYLAGSSRRYGYDLRMELSGTATEPLVTFSSSPPLEAKQVLLMVTAGEVPHDTVTYGATQRAAKLGTYLGQSLINNFGGDATDADRLTISTGERVSRQGRETYNIEYRLNERLTAVGEYDEFDAYNAGLKWRLFAPKPVPKKEASVRPPEKTKEAENVAR